MNVGEREKRINSKKKERKIYGATVKLNLVTQQTFLFFIFFLVLYISVGNSYSKFFSAFFFLIPFYFVYCILFRLRVFFIYLFYIHRSFILLFLFIFFRLRFIRTKDLKILQGLHVACGWRRGVQKMGFNYVSAF